jgi:hypothetical protein
MAAERKAEKRKRGGTPPIGRREIGTTLAAAALLSLDAAAADARRRLDAGGIVADLMPKLNLALTRAGWPSIADSTFYKAQLMARAGFEAGSFEAYVATAMREACPRWAPGGRPPSEKSLPRGSKADLRERIAAMILAGRSAPAVPPAAVLETLARAAQARAALVRRTSRAARPDAPREEMKETDDPGRDISEETGDVLEFVVERGLPRGEREQARSALADRDLPALKNILSRGRLSSRDLTALLFDASRMIDPLDWNRSCPFCLALMAAGADPRGTSENSPWREAPEGRTKWLMRAAIDIRKSNEKFSFA